MVSTPFSRKPLFWLLLIIVSVAGIVFAWKYFSRSFPIVNLDLKMDRQEALKGARQLAAKYHWAPADYQEVASFELDDEVQRFVELEAGGSEAFGEMVKGNLYDPYYWHVRHFKENEIKEHHVYFTPLGVPCGFVESLPEKDPGPALDEDAARAIAEKTAQNDWNIKLNEYELIEKSHEVRPGGRVDHSFVYERPNVKIGEGRYRLRLIVSGDHLTALNTFIKIPEAFTRRYTEMRSANDTIANFAQLAMVVGYLFGGCVIGLFLLARRRWVIWKTPVFIAVIVALLGTFASISEWPMDWMNYDTAVGINGFIMDRVVHLASSFVSEVLLLAITFMAAESLSRRAFPHHLQQWKLWTSDSASTISVLGRTVGGYLFIGFDLTYVVGFYFATSHLLGWWDPSESLVEPNVLAAHIPWLTPIAQAFHAGIWEESLFRAIPLACASLIGRRWGARRFWLGLGMLVQALIFASCHANYPTQPAYARVAELIIPSLIWGAVYLRFGLLPGIISHFGYDATLMSLPLFVSSAPGIWIQRMFVILCVLVPVWIVLIARFRKGKWGEVIAEAYNAAWLPEPKAERVSTDGSSTGPVFNERISLFSTWALMACGIIGLMMSFFVSETQNDAPPLSITPGEARALAKKALEQSGVQLNSSWKILTEVQGGVGDEDRFIWQKGAARVYRSLIGSYLMPPVWRIRFARFDGDVAERAEEYDVLVRSKDKIFSIEHRLPEDRSGASLDESAARIIAGNTLREKFNLNPDELVEISAEPAKLKARTDWDFTFADKKNYPLEEGEARIKIKIAGDQVVDYYRQIHIPEEWSRLESNRATMINIINSSRSLIVTILILVGLVASIVSWTRRQYSVRVFWQMFLLLAFCGSFSAVNSWPTVMASFSTSEPLSHQIAVTLSKITLQTLIFSAVGALLAGFARVWARPQLGIQPSHAWTIAVSWTLVRAGLLSIAFYVVPKGSPIWADFSGADFYLPMFGWTSQILSLVRMMVVAILLYATVDRYTVGWTRRKLTFGSILFLCGFILTSARSDIREWLLYAPILGTILILGYRFIFRYHLELVPLVSGFVVIIDLFKQLLLNAYPGAISNSLTGIIGVGALSFYIYKILAERNRNASKVAEFALESPLT